MTKMRTDLYNGLAAHLAGYVVEEIYSIYNNTASAETYDVWDKEDDTQYTPEAQIEYDAAYEDITRILGENDIEGGG